MEAGACGQRRAWPAGGAGTRSGVRWDSLFDDLEGRLEAADSAELAAEVRERERAERARLRVVDRLRGALGREIEVTLAGGRRERGALRRVGADCVLLAGDQGGEGAAEVLVALAAVQSVGGLTARSAEPGSEGVVGARLGLAGVLRGLARDRARVRVLTGDGAQLAGVLSRVGADYVEMTEEAGGGEARLLPLAALASVRTAGPP